MRRLVRLGFLILIAIVAGVLGISLANYYITTTTDLAVKGTVAASAVTLFGVIFSALYKEISAYYQERSQSICRKWDLIFPFIENHYNPWIGAAQSLLAGLKSLNPDKLSDDAVTRVLYLTTLFYGRRLRFIINVGGLLLLTSDNEEKKVMQAYREIEKNFAWAGDNGETPKRVSYLQRIFISQDKVDAPLVSWTFSEILQKDPILKESKDKLQQWLTKKENIKNLEVKVNDFVVCFKSAIDKLYTAWGD